MPLVLMVVFKRTNPLVVA